MAALDLLEEAAQQLDGDVIGAVIIVAVLREVALDLVIGNEALLVADALDLGVLDGGQGVDHMAEAGNAGSEGAADIGVDQGHLGSLIVVLVVHILDEVQDVDIQPGQPVHHDVVLGRDLAVVEVLGGDGGVSGADLLAELLIDAAVDGVKQALGEVRTCAEELHLLAGLGGGNAAADGVVIAPDRLHDVVVLILDAGRVDGDFRRIVLEGLGQGAGIQHRHVRLGGGAHVLERMQEAEVVLGDHGAAIHADAADLEGRPDGVAAEQLVVAGDAGELDHTELHDHVVDQLLGLALGQGAVVQITLDVDVQEGGHTANGHGSAVLGLDGGQIAEVQPLDGLFCVGGGLGDVEAVGSSHLLHALQGGDLHRDLLALADDLLGHRAVAAVGKVVLLGLDEVVDAVQRHAAVVADDTAAAIGVGQAGDDVAVAGLLHLGGVGIEHGLIMGAGVLGENLMQLLAGLVAVGGAGLLRHLDAAVGHEGALQGLIGLQADDLLEVLQLGVDVAGAVGGQAGDDLGLHVQHAALGTLGLLQLLQRAPQLVGSVGRTGEETLIAVIRGVVLLDEVTSVDFLFPNAAFKAFPLFEICHCAPLLMYGPPGVFRPALSIIPELQGFVCCLGNSF